MTELKFEILKNDHPGSVRAVRCAVPGGWLYQVGIGLAFVPTVIDFGTNPTQATLREHGFIDSSPEYLAALAALEDASRSESKPAASNRIVIFARLTRSIRTDLEPGALVSVELPGNCSLDGNVSQMRALIELAHGALLSPSENERYHVREELGKFLHVKPEAT